MNENKKKKVLTLDDLLENLYNEPQKVDTAIKPLEEKKSSNPPPALDLDSPENLSPDSDINNDLLSEATINKDTQTPKIDFSHFTEAEILQQKAIIEAGLFTVGSEGLNIHDLKRILSDWELNSDYIHNLMRVVKQEKDDCLKSGVTVEKLGENYKMVTKPVVTKNLSKLIRVQMKSILTPALLEVLAIIAYNEPCTKGLVEKIRNSDATSNIDKLINLDLIYRQKRAEVPGRPWLYKLTAKFYDIFGIKSTQQLPKLSLKLQTNLTEDENQSILSDEDVNFFDINRMDHLDNYNDEEE